MASAFQAKSDNPTRTAALRVVSLASVLALPLLFLGAVTHAGLLASAIAAAVFAWLARRHTKELTRRARLATGVLVSTIALGALQLVPLPNALLRALSPRAAAFWADADAASEHVRAFHPLTLDPAATAFAVGTLAVLTLIFATTARLVRRWSRESILLAVAAAVGTFCVIALAHTLIRAETVYGFYAPRSSLAHSLPIVTPLVNPNHAAAAAGVGIPLFVGLALGRHATAERRVACMTFAAVCLAVAMLTLSRGGALVALAESAVMLGYVLLRGPRNERAGRSLPLLASAVAGIGGAFYVAESGLAHEAHRLEPSKLRLIGQALSAVRDFPLFGVGLGASGTLSGTYLENVNVDASDPVVRRFSHVESWPADLVVGVGPVAAALIVLGLGIAIAPAVRRATRTPESFGALVALAGLLVHDLADFSLHYVGVGALGAALLATQTSASGRRPAVDEPDSWASRLGARAPWIVPAGVVALVAALLVTTWGHLLVDDLERAGADRGASAEAAIAAHPTESYFVMMKGVREFRTARAAGYLHRAAELAPLRPQPHFWLARWLVAAGLRPQAWAEYRATVRLAPAMVTTCFDDMAKFRAPIVEFVDVAFDAAALELAANALVANGRAADLPELDELLIERHPPATAARARKVRRAIKEGRDAEARQEASALILAAPRAPDSYVVAAEAAAKPEDAEQVLADGLAVLPDDPTLLEDLIRRRGSRLGLSEVQGEIARMNAKCVAASCVPRVHAAQGEAELARGHLAAALKHFRAAVDASHDGLQYLDRVASIAEALGMKPLALESWSRLASAYPGRPEYAAALQRVSGQGKGAP